MSFVFRRVKYFISCVHYDYLKLASLAFTSTESRSHISRLDKTTRINFSHSTVSRAVLIWEVAVPVKHTM